MELSMYEETRTQFSAAGNTQDLHEPTVLFSVIFCFIVIVVFLIMFSDRILLETSASIQLPVPELSMVIAKLPFQVDFQHLDQASITGGVVLKISTTETVEMSCYWGASCQLFIQALNSDPFYLLYEVEHLDHTESASMTLGSGDNQSFHLAPEASEEDLNFGPPPRSKYPLVIILRCSGVLDSDNENTIVGGIWILHLPDSSFSTPGHVISNLVITNHGLVHNLQKMYMAADTVNSGSMGASPNVSGISSSIKGQETSGNDLSQVSSNGENESSQSCQSVCGEATGQSYGACTNLNQSCTTSCTYQSQCITRMNTNHQDSSCGDSTFNDPRSHEERLRENSVDTLNDGQHDCTVCQNGAISRVILPCRHACICEECLQLVTKCPMCRGPIISHFSLNPSTTEGHDRETGKRCDSWFDYLQELNDRLNRSLGFA